VADELRVKGQEMQIRLTKGGELLRTITAIESLTLTLKVDIIRKGYQGETIDRRDDIYRGVGVEIAIDAESPDVIDLLTAIRDRAARRTANANVQINLTFSINFLQKRARITVPDLMFQDPSLTSSGRDAYISLRLSGEGQDFIPIGQ